MYYKFTSGSLRERVGRASGELDGFLTMGPYQAPSLGAFHRTHYRNCGEVGGGHELVSPEFSPGILVFDKDKKNMEILSATQRISSSYTFQSQRNNHRICSRCAP